MARRREFFVFGPWRDGIKEGLREKRFRDIALPLSFSGPAVPCVEDGERGEQGKWASTELGL